MNFLETKTKLYNHLITLDKSSEEYARKLLAYSSVLEKMFPVEFNQLVQKAEVSVKMILLNQVAMDMIKELDRYNINPELKTIEVFMDDQTLTAPLINLPEYIKNNFKYDTDEDFLFILSFLVRMNNFEIIQIAECIING